MSTKLNSISNRNLSTLYENSIIDSEIEFESCPKDKILNFSTGFGANNELHITNPCPKSKLKTPLYQENYLSEFVTEEEKAAARRALGLYSQDDVEAMSLLTAEDTIPSQQILKKAPIKQLQKGNKFFAPVTTFKAVYDSSGITLEAKMQEMNALILKQQKELTSLSEPSKSKTITSLGDVKLFLKGFNNGDTLQETLDDMNQDLLRFEKTGQIS